MNHRKTAGYSQEEIAAHLGMSQNQYSRYERGENQPGGDVVGKMATTLGVSADYLLGIADTPEGEILEETLSDDERQLLEAYRTGRLQDLLKVALQKVAVIDHSDDQPVVPAKNQTIKG